MLRFLFISLSLLFSNFVFGQDRCATENLYKNIYGEESEIKRQEFERWLDRKKEIRRTMRIEEDILQIPVVVHIIHDGEAVGEGKNLSYAQVLSQIDVLNEDFRRTNPDRTATPEEFLPVAADVGIEFVLAKQDPEGFETTGIVRKQGSQDVYLWSESSILKNESYWPAEDYLNIWVADITNNNSGLAGYATFPETDLEGINDPNRNRYIDGVVVDYLAFGSELIYPQGNYSSNWNRGRTATHEIGHFLGLLHTFSDNGGGCEDNDFCTDTPTQSTASSSCIITGESCGSRDMVQNYLDYTNDACMNIFTLQQKERMRIVMSESPRRLSLISSHALKAPNETLDNLGISQLLSPRTGQCTGILEPAIEIRNYGNNTVSSGQIELYIDNVLAETIQLNETIEPLETSNINFSSYEIPEGANTSVKFIITSVNDKENTNLINFSTVINVYVPFSINLPFSEEFNTFPLKWTIQSPNNERSWEIANAPSTDIQNKALRLENYSNQNIGEIDGLLSPSFTIPENSKAFLNFKYAYATYNSTSDDGLLVGVLSDCDFSLTKIDTLFYNRGTALETVPSTTTFYTPENQSDWADIKFLDLSKYAGLGKIQIVFLGINDYGNNLYIDSINITTEGGTDVAITSILSPSLYSCQPTSTPTITIRNEGFTILNSLLFDYRINVGNLETLEFTNLDLAPGEYTDLQLPENTFSFGTNSIFMNLREPNGNSDSDVTNNTLQHIFAISDEEVAMPYRWKFEDGEIEWVNISPGDNSNWERDSQGYARFTPGNEIQGNKSWYFSPLFSLEDFIQASMFFDLSYASKLQGTDELQVLVSTNCGLTYDYEVFSKSGSDLATVEEDIVGFKPENETDWRTEFIDMSEFAGLSDLRVAFVATEGSGKIIYLDNIEFFNGNDPFPLQIENNFSRVYPNPTSSGYFNLTFKLEEHETVQVSVYNNKGAIVVDKMHENVLNQTFNYPVFNLTEQLYFVRIVGETFTSTQKLLIKK